MIAAITVDVSGRPDAHVAAVRVFIGSQGFLAIAGYEGQRTVREHLQGLDQSRANKMGGKRTHYYGSARKATEYRIDGEGVIINIPQIGLPLHYYGGTVKAGANSSYVTGEPTKYLTIPARAEAYGKSVSDFHDLVIVWGRNRKPVGLAIGEERRSSLTTAITQRGPVLTKDKNLVPGLVLFWLKKEITLKPDPSILPTEETLGANITDRLGKAIVRRFGGDTTEPEADLGGGI